MTRVFSDWVEREKKSFQDIKDKNSDGYLDKKELEDWIVPSEVSYSQEEAKHLIEVIVPNIHSPILWFTAWKYNL